jgi:hypothetical protein
MLDMLQLSAWRVMDSWHFVVTVHEVDEYGNREAAAGAAGTRSDVTDETVEELLTYTAEELFNLAPLMRKDPPV